MNPTGIRNRAESFHYDNSMVTLEDLSTATRNPCGRVATTRTTAYGPPWQQRLRRMWRNPKCSLRSMARELGVDPITVKRQAAKLDLPLPRTIGARAVSTAKIYQKVNHTAELAASQAQWLEHIHSNPGLGVKALRLLQPALYFRLYRADRVWLKRHSPRATKPAGVQLRVDWAARDTDLAARLKGIVTDPHFTEHQRTPTALLQRAQAPWFRARQAVLPLSRQALLDLTESREDYACRRIQAVLDRGGWKSYGTEQVTPIRWQLCKRAGLRTEVARMPKVAALLRLVS